MALKSTLTPTRLASVAELIGIDARELEDFFICEEWGAELATGLLTLGPETAALHGIASTPCGIMDLISLYDLGDRQKVLLALEEAATISTKFSYATTLRPTPGLYRPVFCFAQSETADGTGGIIRGTFAVARLCIEVASSRSRALN
jgi:hypothetical protein